MIYAMSDIHGCYQQYKELLEKIHFSEDDILYVLGDVIDRGPEPLKVLQDMASRINVIPLIGNHEYMALTVLKKLMMEITEENCESVLNYEFMQQYQHWLGDGGQVTVEQFKKLPMDEKEFLIDAASAGKIYKENRHIAIDCGCVFGHRLGVYCFDTGECVYSSEMK